MAAPRIKIGADVLPWWPAQGVYLLLEHGTTPPADLVDVDGVGGVWSVASQDVDATTRECAAPASSSRTASSTTIRSRPPRRLRPVLDARWAQADVEPLLAAPFHPVVPYEWDRYVP